MPRKRRNTPWLDTRNGVYYACWYDPAARRSRRFSLSTEDADEARRRFADFLVPGEASGGKAVTVRSVLAAYLTDHVDKNTADPGRIHNAADQLLNFFGDTPLTEVDIPLCRKYASERRSGRLPDLRATRNTRGGSDGTIRRELSTLGAAARHALKWRLIPAADMPSIEAPPAAPPRERWLTPEELRRLRDAAESQDVRDYIDLLYYTASRRRAIESLTWFQVDIERRRIQLIPPGQRQTKKRRPIVPMDLALVPLFERRRRETSSENVIDLSSPAYRFAKAAKAAGLTDVSPHVLRHTRATHLLQAGKPIYAVAKLLGDTVATVERTYGHHCPDYLNDVLDGKTAAQGMLE